MKNKYQSQSRDRPSFLSPWQTDHDDTLINNYCQSIATEQSYPCSTLPQISFRQGLNSRHQNSQTKKKRVMSQVRNENICERQSEMGKTLKRQTSCGRYLENRQNSINTKVIDRKRQKGVVLQQISVKNFIIEGGQPLVGKQWSKKRQSSFVMKQKFAQFRRSIKVMQQLKQNMNMRIFRMQG